MILQVNSDDEMKAFGTKLGGFLKGGEILELIGDVGAGKTTLTKGIATGLGINEDVGSPSFTINRLYHTPTATRQLAHYDFYRLTDAGIMSNELAETIQDPATITVIEWGKIVEGILPLDRLSIYITTPSEKTRLITIAAGGEKSHTLLGKLT